MSKKIILVIIMFVIVSAVVSVVFVMSQSNKAARAEKMSAYNAINHRLEKTFATMNDFPGSAGKDILFLRVLSSAQNMRKSSSLVMLPEMRDDFKNFLNNKNFYKDIFFYKKDFNCAIRENYDGQDEYSCEALTPFMSEIVARVDSLVAEEIYISPIVSYADISLKDEDKAVSVVVYAMPVNADCAIISVIDVDYFLDEFRRSTRDGESVFLLDRDGYYLANSNRSKEKFFGGINDNFYKDFPEAPLGILSDVNVRVFETDTKIMTFGRIYPTESNFAIYEGSNKIMGEGHTDEYFWTMAVVSDRLGINPRHNDFYGVLIIATIMMSHIFVAGLMFFKFFIPTPSRNTLQS